MNNKMHSQIIAIGIVMLITSQQQAHGLSCYVGLGNTSERNEQKIVECPPEEKYYVCVKMFGGGMGDQIRRKCEKLSPHEYQRVIDEEIRKLEAQRVGVPLEEDPTCHETTDRGRDVTICYCSTEQCNSAHRVGSTSILASLIASSILFMLLK